MSHPSRESAVAARILALPSALQIDLFTKWVHLKDIARLDSALCSTTFRKPFICSWKEAHCLFGISSEDIRLEPPIAGWVAKRGIKVINKVIFSDEMIMYPELDDFFRSTGDTITYFVYTELFASTMRPNKPKETVESFVSKVLHCPNLRTLETHQVPWRKGDLREVLTKLKKITTLKLGFALEVDFLAINECGHSIETIEMYFYQGPKTDMFSRGYYQRDGEDVNYTPSHSLRKFVFLDGSMYGDYRFLRDFVRANKGLREAYIDRIGWYDMTFIVYSCPELTVLRLDLMPRDLDDDHYENDDHLPNLTDYTKNVRYLQLSTTYYGEDLFSESQVLTLLRACPQYVVLVLFDMKAPFWLCDKRPLPVPLAPVSPSTSCLQVLHVRTLSLPALRQVFALCPHLVELGVTDPDDLPGLVALVVEKKIRRLHLQLREGHTVEALHNLRDLEFLNLFDCTELRAADLVAIAKSNPDLTYIRAYDCKRTGGLLLLELPSLCPQLRSLHIDNGSENREGMCLIMKNILPTLEEVYLAFSNHHEEGDDDGSDFDEDDEEMLNGSAEESDSTGEEEDEDEEGEEEEEEDGESDGGIENVTEEVVEHVE